IEKFDKSFEVFPLDSQLKKRVWRWGKETVENNKKDLIAKKSGDKIKIYTKDRLKNEKKQKTLWDDSKYSAVSHGSMRLKKNDIDFSFPKSIYLMKDIIHILTNDNSIILDITAGSGTTGCAVQTINNEESKNRNFILIEQMNYINTSTIKALKLEVEKDSFIYLELAEYNEEAKNKIDACKSFKELKKLFTELTEYYFLNYNVSVKQFNDQLLEDKDFQELPLEEQKTLFKALLDNNQLYIPYKEQEDGKYNLSKEDQKLTNEFYERS
ncbi:MAG: DNA methyltransferase, partial [Pseudomonadota bacterium]|nr:DNA methyltransferase [Pseudomonadota bacterium]